MAGAKPGVHALQLKPVIVHEELKKGSKFIRWEEPPLEPKVKDSANSTPVLGTLKVDENGFYLTWIAGGQQETEIIDMWTICDTRKGKFAKSPKDPKLREKLSYEKEGFESKLLTIIYGVDMVNVSFICLLGLDEKTTQIWTDELFDLATNILSRNSSRTRHLYKAYTKLKLHGNLDGRIPMKHFLKLFSDKKRVETAMEQCNLNNNKSESIKTDDLTWEVFLKFLDNLCIRPELQSIFEECGARRKPFISLDQFLDFLNDKQRDSRLNEVLYPPLKRDQVRQVMEKFESNLSQLERDQLSLQGFSRFLNSEENNSLPLEKLDLFDDMNHSLAHYFINSSHNTYLTVGQLTGASSVEMYRQVLLTGCRCIELDCWKGKPPDEEPYITHGFTMTTEIPFKDVIEAIAETAFKASPYPVILSFENHVDSPKQQAKMAEYCRTIFGDALLIDPLDKYPLEQDSPLPSPQDLLGKILIKNKKKPHLEKTTVRRKDPVPTQPSPSRDSPLTDTEGQKILSNGDQKQAEKAAKDPGQRGEGESEEEEENEMMPEGKKAASEEGTALNEVSATEEMSNLVNYIQPVKFKGFDNALRRRRHYEMSSFVETKAIEILKTFPFECLAYNKKQLSRIYPKGTRVDSSNYMPQLFWNIGCQMVALNFQTLDLPMQLNMGVFEYNGHSGYLLKPEIMTRGDKQFDPYTEDIVDGIVANTVTVRIISGQFLTDKKVGVYVEVNLFGLPRDTKRRFKTRTSNGNSMDPVWEDGDFVFYKVILPSLASLRISAYEENGRFIGHRILPVSSLKRGYRYINLRTEFNQPLLMASLLVYIEAKDFVPNQHLEYIEALTNPIKHISQLEAREKMLAYLMEDSEDDMTETEDIPDSLLSPEPALPSSPLEETPEWVPAPVQSPTEEDFVVSIVTDIPSMSLEDLRQQKNLTKLKKKQLKDFSELRKKNQKKIQSESQKKHATIEKNFKRSIKKGDSQDKIGDLEKQKAQLWEYNMQELLELRQSLYMQEKQMQLQHQAEEHEKLKLMVTEYQELHTKKLTDTCTKEKKEIQKILEKKRIQNLVEAKKKDPGLQLPDFNKKHINDCVEIFRKLEKLQSMRKEKFLLKHLEMTQQMESLLTQLESQLNEKLEEEYRQLPREISQYLPSDLQNKGACMGSPLSGLSNHSSPTSSTPSNCSTPWFPRSFDKSMDNNLGSLHDSTSSSTTPALSESELSFN
ncbi:PREDICTED: 1-phosphatidylinositol 4,5-bisphosphate phosphodiesterase beta-3-like isoform X1 [Poecilia mexicana]|uniref:1-phosphatidylinositol 4,5-bisphosphate phosphodiesterase beta-3-like isoform X1 n=1 Tax=Poecilia mexicana TaxID=48701 RepID=UPI00072E3CC5|nr:PREDICTED: 1-phosphatidylinositol 4,5-bisphosphate phosphodiesterase beta-3-like isoform X1 [Poecilia mexicana]